MAGALFLPFTPQARRVEELAIKIKGDHKIAPYTAVAPLDLAGRMGVAVVARSWFDGLPPDLAKILLANGARDWSAGSISCDGTLVIALNPTHGEGRRTISLGEELVHESLGHPKSQLQVIDGVTMRTCDHSIEDEAYSVAAALLMPYRPLFNHVDVGQPLSTLPVPAEVSIEAREFRVKRAGLWRVYQARLRAAGTSKQA